MKLKLLRALPWLLLGLMILARCRNWLVYPHTFGYDAYGHCNYLDLILEKGRLPHPNEGWQTYHPPGFYQMSAWLAEVLGWTEMPHRYRAGQLLSCLAGLVSLLAVYFLSRRLLPALAPWPVLFFSVLPAAVFVSAMVYNLSLALAFVSCFIVLIVFYWGEPPSFLREASLGLCLGLAVLARSDAAPLGLLLIFRAINLARQPDPRQSGPAPWRLEILLGLGLSLAVLGAVTSWFFLRNISLHGHLLVSNVDPDMYPLPYRSTLGLPGFFSLRFLVDSGGSVWHNPIQPEGMSSLSASIYASFWTDHVGSWPSLQGLSRWRLLAGALPSCLCLVGLWAVWGKREWLPVLSVFCVNVLTGLWLINKVSTYTGYKAVYLYASFPVWALLSAAGLQYLEERDTRLATVAQGLLLLCYAFLGMSLVWMGSGPTSGGY